jgi:hypothetical protein
VDHACGLRGGHAAADGPRPCLLLPCNVQRSPACKRPSLIHTPTCCSGWLINRILNGFWGTRCQQVDHLSMAKDADTCSKGKCTRPRYQGYALCLSCGLSGKKKWALQVAATGSVAKCRVPECGGKQEKNSKYCAQCWPSAV